MSIVIVLPMFSVRDSFDALCSVCQQIVSSHFLVSCLSVTILPISNRLCDLYLDLGKKYNIFYALFIHYRIAQLHLENSTRFAFHIVS